MAKFGTVAETTPTEFLASSHVVKLSGTAGAALAKGVLLMKDVAGKYIAYAGGVNDVAVGISADSALKDDQVAVVVHGVVYQSKVAGYDAAAKTDLPGIIFLADEES